MRRPVVCYSCAFGAGILLTFLLDISMQILVVFTTVLMIFTVCSHLYEFREEVKLLSIIICIMAIGGCWFSFDEFRVDSLAQQEGKTVSLQGIVTELDINDESCSIVIKSDNSKVLAKYYGDSEHLKKCKGRSVLVFGTAELPVVQRNPRCFDYRLYLRSCGIQTIVKAEKIEIIKGKEIPYLKMTGYVRNLFGDKLSKYVDDTSRGLIKAIMFGDKTMLDEELYSDFQKNGTAHVLAVSGLHTGILYAFFVFLWRWRKGGIFYFAVSMILLFYMSLADFSPSVVRASLMILLHLISGIFKYRYDLLTAAGITFSAMLFINPYQLFNTGFQLSFLAVVSLAVIIPFVKRHYQGVFLSAIAIQAGMVPYTAYVFNYISIGSILANIPIIFIAGIMLPVGICALAGMFVSDNIFGFLIKMMELCGDALIGINDFFYISGKTSFDVISPPVWLLVLYYALIFTVLSESGQLMIIRKEIKKLILVAAGICAVTIMSVFVMAEPFDKACIVFVDVGQGDCIHIKTDSGKNYLIDGGGDADYDVGRKILKPYLLRNGVDKIDAAFVTHLHEDHYGGIKALTEEGMVEMVCMYEANRMTDVALDAEILYLHRGYSINLDEDVFLEVISPEPESEQTYNDMIKNEEDENKLSLILKVKYKGKTLLVTGDIDEEGEYELIKKYRSDLPCDIMKVPHHGSKYSSSQDFLDATKPVLAVFQVGNNNYGHPSAEAIRRYRENGCEVTRNDINGAIGLMISKDKSFKVITMLN